MKETPEQTPFKVGEEVVTNRFTHDYPIPNDNFGLAWNPDMSQFIGKKGTITDVKFGGGFFKVHGFIWPLSALTRASEAETVEELANKAWADKAGDYAAYHPSVCYMAGFMDGHAADSAHISALQKEVKALREAQRWIPVSERLPEPCKYADRYQNLCNVIADNGYAKYEALAYYGEGVLDPDDIDWHIIADEHRIFFHPLFTKPTHWIAIPKYDV